MNIYWCKEVFLLWSIVWINGRSTQNKELKNLRFYGDYFMIIIMMIIIIDDFMMIIIMIIIMMIILWWFYDDYFALKNVLKKRTDWEKIKKIEDSSFFKPGTTLYALLMSMRFSSSFTFLILIVIHMSHWFLSWIPQYTHYYLILSDELCFLFKYFYLWIIVNFPICSIKIN